MGGVRLALRVRVVTHGRAAGRSFWWHLDVFVPRLSLMTSTSVWVPAWPCLRLCLCVCLLSLYIQCLRPPAPSCVWVLGGVSVE